MVLESSLLSSRAASPPYSLVASGERVVKPGEYGFEAEPTGTVAACFGGPKLSWLDGDLGSGGDKIGSDPLVLPLFGLPLAYLSTSLEDD